MGYMEYSLDRQNSAKTDVPGHMRVDHVDCIDIITFFLTQGKTSII